MTLSGFPVMDLNWAQIQKFGFYGPIWRPEPYYNFTVELILYGIIFWVVAHWYVERRDRARWTAKLTGEETTSSDHDILTEKRLFQILRVAIVVSIIFAFTVPIIEADLTESQTYRNRNRMYEELYSKQDGIAISPGDYFSHDMSLDNGTRISFEYTCSNLLDAYILSDQEYENYLKSSRSSQYIFKKNDTQINTGILSEIYKIPQSTILSWIESNWAPELESLIIGMGRINTIGFTVPEDGRYWFVISNAYNSTTAYPSEFTVTEYWYEYETITKRVRVGRKTMTLFELIFGTR